MTDDTIELKINFDGSISSTYVMKYKTIVTETDGEVNSTVDFSGNNFDKKTVESEKLSAQQFYMRRPNKRESPSNKARRR